jgi:hypothetical protein
MTAWTRGNLGCERDVDAGKMGRQRSAVGAPFLPLVQDGADWVSGFPREPVPVAAWPADRKVAVSLALFVEEFGFGQGPVFRPDLASRSPDLVNEAFRQYSIEWGNARVGRLFRELDVPLTIMLNAEFPRGVSRGAASDSMIWHGRSPDWSR